MSDQEEHPRRPSSWWQRHLHINRPRWLPRARVSRAGISAFTRALSPGSCLFPWLHRERASEEATHEEPEVEWAPIQHDAAISPTVVSITQGTGAHVQSMESWAASPGTLLAPSDSTSITTPPAPPAQRDTQICTPDRDATPCTEVTTSVAVSLPSGHASVEGPSFPPIQPNVEEVDVRSELSGSGRGRSD